MSGPRRIPDDIRAQVIQLLRDGVVVSVIAKRAGVSQGTVYGISKQTGIAYKKADFAALRRAYLEQIARERAAPVVREGPNYRGMASSLRWNSGLGGLGWRS